MTEAAFEDSHYYEQFGEKIGALGDDVVRIIESAPESLPRTLVTITPPETKSRISRWFSRKPLDPDIRLEAPLGLSERGVEEAVASAISNVSKLRRSTASHLVPPVSPSELDFSDAVVLDCYVPNGDAGGSILNVAALNGVEGVGRAISYVIKVDHERVPAQRALTILRLGSRVVKAEALVLSYPDELTAKCESLTRQVRKSDALAKLMHGDFTTQDDLETLVAEVRKVHGGGEDISDFLDKVLLRGAAVKEVARKFPGGRPTVDQLDYMEARLNYLKLVIGL